jgi:uncharacterized protein (TIGR02145 family)
VHGALLDLNSPTGNKGGLLLSNVELTDLTTIPFEGPNAFPGVDSDNKEDVKFQFRGAIVYHTGGNDIAAGVYVWNGKWWTPADGTPVNTVIDAEGNDYTTGHFGAAGWWMTQNLRTTDFSYVDGIQTPLVKKYESMSTGSTSEPRYTFPGSGYATARENALTSEQLKAYGLLYNWVAASGRNTDATDDDTQNRAGFGAIPSGATHYRGVCPENWHLPSDYEWSELEKEIALHPEKYSSWETAYGFTDNITYDNLYTSMATWRPGNATNQLDTYWGRQMTSTTRVTGVPGNNVAINSSSMKREEGGFDALLVGTVYDSNIAEGYSYYAYFWSSSSYNSNGVRRTLYISNTGMHRGNLNREYLCSVRCKKD